MGDNFGKATGIRNDKGVRIRIETVHRFVRSLGGANHFTNVDLLRDLDSSADAPTSPAAGDVSQPENYATSGVFR
jgi:hypothetical protein